MEGMIFFFFLYSFHKSIKINKLKNSNTSIVAIIPANEQNQDSLISTLIKQIKEFLHNNFQEIIFQNISYQVWSDKYKIKISDETVNFALFRYNKFVEIYPGLINQDSFRNYLILALLSHVIIIKENDIPFILKTKKRCFILHNDHIYYEYENAAFLYKYSKVTFYFVEGPFSLVFYDNVNRCSRKYDFSRSVTMFIKSCARINRKKIKNFYNNIENKQIMQVGNLTNQSVNIFPNNLQRFQFFVITNTLNNANEINKSLSSLRSAYYNRGNFSIINWNSRYSSNLQKSCQIKPNILTYALSYSKGKSDFCYFYPYEVINNQQHFNNFFQKIINQVFFSNLLIDYKDTRHDIKKTLNSKSNFQKIIPDRDSSIFVFMTNSKSPSNNKAYEAYFLLKYRLSFLNGIKFLELDPTKKDINLPYYVPFNDDFPMFVMWEKNDRRPHIFQNILTNDNLLHFALEHITKK